MAHATPGPAVGGEEIHRAVALSAAGKSGSSGASPGRRNDRDFSGRPWGLLAEFGTSAAIFQACERVRDSGYTRWDSHTPFPVHGLDQAMGLKRSILPWIVFVAGLTGAGFGLLMQWWTSAVDYPLVISGKPLFSWQAFVPIMFELMVLFAAGASVFGMFHLNRLPTLYHPLFRSERFERATDDRFFISIEARDPRFVEPETRRLLEEAGATHVELIED